METVNLSGLKNNPSEALRRSHQEVVVVLNRDKPDGLPWLGTLFGKAHRRVVAGTPARRRNAGPD